MTSIERTAYPRLKRRPSTQELADVYTPTVADLAFIRARDARSAVDRDTRLRIALASVQAAALWRLLGERLTDQEKGAADAG